MRPAENINNLIKKLQLKASTDLDRRVHDDISMVPAESDITKSARAEPNIWRTIMKTRKAKLTAAAAIFVVAALSLTIFKQMATPVWAIEQTIKALQDIKTLVITGDDYYSSGPIPFKCSFRLSNQGSDLFDMRYESEKLILVVSGTKAWEYRPKENLVRIYEDVTDSERMMRDLRFWYKVASLNPWLTGKILGNLKLFADDWQEVYGQDERTRRDCVFVECSYEPLSNSFWLAFDVENKLIVEARYWSNTDREGLPIHATDFFYNEEIGDEVFEFQIPDGAEVVYRWQEKEYDALFTQAKQQFKADKFAEAIEVYQDMYEKYPEFKLVAAQALRRMGTCYERMGQFDKAIDSYKKGIEEVPPNFKVWKASSYLFLGRVYVQINRKAEALEAFRNCLTIGSEVRDPDWPASKEARKYIQELESQP